jgi:hypothetical protein
MCNVHAHTHTNMSQGSSGNLKLINQSEQRSVMPCNMYRLNQTDHEMTLEV